MLKYYYYLLFIWSLLLVTLSAVAQNSVDSLLQRLQSTQETATQITILEKLGDLHKTRQADSAMVYYDLALEKCTKSSFLANKAALLNKKAGILNKKGDTKALEVLLAANDCYKELEDTLGIAKVEKGLGITFYYQKKNDKALKHYSTSLNLFEQLNAPAEQAKVLNNIAVLYRLDEKYERAIDIYTQSLTLKEALHDSTGIALTLMNLGLLYVNTKQEELFKAHFQKSKAIFSALKATSLIAKCNFSYGTGLMEFEEWSEAKILLTTALAYYQDKPYRHEYEVALNRLGKIAMHEKDFQGAVTLFKKGFSLNKKNGRKIMMEAHLRDLSLANFELKNYQTAYQYLEQAYILQDTIKNERRIELIEEMQTKFDVQQKDAVLKIKNLEVAEQRKSKKAFMLVCGLLSLLLFSGFYTLIQKNKHHKILSGKHQLLEKALSEKDLLVKEIHHRVKNNLQFISSLLSLQSRHITDKNAITALESSQNRIQSMSLLHHNLYQKEHLASVNMKDYLEQLIKTNLHAYSVITANIQVNQEIASIFLDIDKAVPIGLIVNELINNIFKHAFPNKDNGVVFVSFQQEKEKLLITVKDNGKGVDTEDSKYLTSESFGLKLINLLVKKLNASWKMSGTNGTSVFLEVPYLPMLNASH